MWRMNLLGQPQCDTLCSSALHHIWPISAFIHTPGSLNFYIFTLLLHFWLILTPYWPRILSTAPCCNIPTRAAVQEVFFYSSNHSWDGLPENFRISLCQLLHQLVIRKTILCHDIPVRKNWKMSGRWPGTKMGQCWRIQTHFSLTLHWNGFRSAWRLAEV